MVADAVVVGIAVDPVVLGIVVDAKAVVGDTVFAVIVVVVVVAVIFIVSFPTND